MVTTKTAGECFKKQIETTYDDYKQYETEEVGGYPNTIFILNET